MIPREGSCQKLRICVYIILLKLFSENYWLLFSGHGVSYINL